MRRTPEDPPAQPPTAPAPFDPDSTHSFQAKMPAAPVWFSSMVAGNSREKNRVRSELGQIRGGLRLLVKPGRGQRWTTEERHEIRKTLRSMHSVSPYLLIWALPGSVLILPFLAWHLDARRKRRQRRAQQAAARQG